jgi:hypothetical protein
MKMGRIAGMLIVGGLMLGSCQSAPPDRSARLLGMAGEEAANIPNKLDRFTRQLNIADTQLRISRPIDAAKTLALARDTLNAAAKTDFDDFHRIAAWTAISQLSRQAGDRDMALKASDNAQAALNDVLPVTERPQYALSLSWELADLRGKQAAIELLESGSAWAAEIKEQRTRRLALMTFAQQLISLDAFENARNTLRRDPDAAWRTDMFLALANQNAGMPFNLRNSSNAGPGVAVIGGRGGGGGRSFSASAASGQDTAGESNWNKDVRFESVFRQ